MGEGDGAQRVKVQRDVIASLMPAVYEMGLMNQPADDAQAQAHIATVQQSLFLALAQLWGSSSVRTFNDQHGPGWLVNLEGARPFDSVEVYGVIRRVSGEPMLVGVIDPDEVSRAGQVQQTPQQPQQPPQQTPAPTVAQSPAQLSTPLTPSPAPQVTVPQGMVLLPAEQLSQLQGVQAELERTRAEVGKLKHALNELEVEIKALRPKPEDPALIKVTMSEAKVEDEEGGEQQLTMTDERQVTNAEVAAVVQEFFSRGVDPSKIDIWTSLRKPKISVNF